MLTKTRKLENSKTRKLENSKNCKRKPLRCVGVLIIVCLTTFGFSANDAVALDRCFHIVDLGEIGPSVAAHQAWLAQAIDAEAYVSTYVLITILQDQDDE